MKKLICLLSCFVTFCVFADISPWVKDFDKFEDAKDFKYALTILIAHSQELKTDDVDHFFQRDEKHLDFLSTQIKQRNLTCFVFPWQYRDPRRRNELSYHVSDFVQTTYMSVQRLTPYQRKLLDEKIEGQVKIADKESAELIINFFEYLKQKTLILEVFIDKLVTKNTSPEKHKKLIMSLKSQENVLKKHYTDYISYMIISPNLWHVSKLLTIKNRTGVDFTPDSVHVKLTNGIAIYLSRACHKDFLLSANQDVQSQFNLLYHDIKNVLSTKEMGELKAFTTLYESLDNTKIRGAEYWWTKH